MPGAADVAVSFRRPVGLVIRRLLEAASKVLPLMFVLFLPLLLGRHHLYAWMNDPALTERNHWYLHTAGGRMDLPLDHVFRHLDF